jgi:hypothetical protein
VPQFARKVSDMDVVLNLRTQISTMATCITGGCSAAPSTDREVRVLRWTFRRNDEAVVCEVGLNRDHSAYELRVNPPWNPAGTTIEQYDDAVSAFQRHAEIERALVDDGWLLEGFESERADPNP